MIDCDLGALVYQAEANGPEIVSLASFLKSHKIVDAISPKIDIENAMKCSIERYIGFGYDFGADVSDGINLLAGRVGLNWRIDFAEKHASECAALVVRTMLFAAYPQIERLDPRLVDPGQLRDFMRG